jgi:DNA-directed RNA polymerase specialized sigma24 family protein
MTESVLDLFEHVRENKPGSVDTLLAQPRVREIIRVRAHKVRGFPFDRVVDRRMDAQRAAWEVASSIDGDKAGKLKTNGVALAYLSTGIRNRMFRQLRTDLNLRETTVTDPVGRKRFELQPKIARAPFELALAQVDALADPCHVLIAQEAVAEVLRAYQTAPMSATARRVLEWRLVGTPGNEMARRLGKTAPVVYSFLREARAAVRDRLHEVRAGTC